MASDIPYTSRAFTEKQFQTLLALADGYFPSLTQEQIDGLFRDHVPDLIISPKREKIERWLKQPASECRDFVEKLDSAFYSYVPREAKNGIAWFLDLLGGGLATFLLTIPNFTFSPISSLSQAHRSKILKSWSQSYLPFLRGFHRGLQVPFSNILLKCDEILLDALEYPIPTPGVHRKQLVDSPVQAKLDKSAPQHEFNFLDLSNIPQHLLSPSSFAAETHKAFSDETTTLHFDLIIVGSGSGGSVVASTLSRALLPKHRGYRILIIDKGTYYSPETDLPMTENNAGLKMYENGGMLTTTDGQGLMIVPSTWGGGPVINWGISLKLEDEVRREWSDKHGLKFVAPKGQPNDAIEPNGVEVNDWDSCVEYVQKRMGVTVLSDEHHAVPNRLLYDGARKVGYNPRPLPHNNGGRPDEHKDCSYCALGCCRRIKQSGVACWLVDASEAGAIMLKEFDVERVLFNDEDRDKGKPLVALGVEGRKVETGGNGKLVRILASKVVLAAGAIRTPCILKNSGLENPNVGMNLKLHPGFLITGFFDTASKILTNPWDNGPCATVYIPDLTSLHNTGYGSKIMRMDNHPAIALSVLPWTDPASFKLNLCRYKQSITVIVVVREKDSSGSVSPVTKANSGDFSSPKIEYNLEKFDKQSAMEGIIASAKTLLAAGCSEVVPCLGGLPHHLASYKRKPEESDAASSASFEKYAKELRSYLPTAYGTAHLMGTAKMGTSPTTSVVDAETGKVWDTLGLYVADSSLFPTATGVNPMLTVMGLAEWVARSIARETLIELGNANGIGGDVYS